MITQARLHELLSYDPETGAFAWKMQMGNQVVASRAAGMLHSSGYLRTKIDQRIYKNHRLAWLYVHGTWPSGQIDHIDGNRCNNAIGNLRDVTQYINLQNQRVARSDNTSGLLGVSRKGNRWRSNLWVDGKNIHLGTFDTPEEAHTAYLETKRKFHPGCTI